MVLWTLITVYPGYTTATTEGNNFWVCHNYSWQSPSIHQFKNYLQWNNITFDLFLYVYLYWVEKSNIVWHLLSKFGSGWELGMQDRFRNQSKDLVCVVHCCCLRSLLRGFRQYCFECDDLTFWHRQSDLKYWETNEIICIHYSTGTRRGGCCFDITLGSLYSASGKRTCGTYAAQLRCLSSVEKPSILTGVPFRWPQAPAAIILSK